MDEVWSEPLVIRARRASPDPSNYRATAAAVQDLPVNEPLRLAAAVQAAEEARSRTPFGDIVDAYRLYMQSERKRYDKAVSRIDSIERAIGRDHDARPGMSARSALRAGVRLQGTRREYLRLKRG